MVQCDLCDHWCKADREFPGIGAVSIPGLEFPGILKASGLSKNLCKILTKYSKICIICFCNLYHKSSQMHFPSHLHTLHSRTARQAQWRRNQLKCGTAQQRAPPLPSRLLPSPLLLFPSPFLSPPLPPPLRSRPP